MNPISERTAKNEQQYAKIRLVEFVDPSEWEKETATDAWRRKATPVYRKPQGQWANSDVSKERWVYYLSKAWDLPSAVEPEHITFPQWLLTFWDSQSARWLIAPSNVGSFLGKTKSGGLPSNDSGDVILRVSTSTGWTDGPDVPAFNPFSTISGGKNLKLDLVNSRLVAFEVC
jgi:hypothetical protein